MNKIALADQILKRIKAEKPSLRSQYENTKDQIGYLVIDNLLPDSVAMEIYQAFPAADLMILNKNLREDKYIAVQMDQYAPILEAVIFAFQDPRIVDLIKNICSIDTLYPDKNLYAGGLSLMQKGQFLNPHIDNSHEKDRKQWRVLNLLYYVSPGWEAKNGGNLEIWSNGFKEKQITIESLFNRLAIMTTHGASWHSVSPILTDSKRTCVSNYYFSDTALRPDDQFHVTSFRGRPEQKIRDLVLQADAVLRQGIRKIFPKGAVTSDHVYKDPKDS
ncbi:MAG: 2OG-Fe(II) oxygenase [Xanthomonadales bacterium]|nr:2OG-Fe(II) oxygenase [Xanthomonadales bacterium]